MTQPASSRTTVVLDGSNIVHGGKSSISQDPDGNRLISAIGIYESKGYTVLPCMKGGTYFVMSGRAKNMPKAPGYDALEALAKNKQLKVFSKDDDLHVIHLALSRDAWIVTNDTFEDLRHKETGEIIPRERTNYPELDWDLIDEMTWGTCRSGVRAYADDTWRIDGQKFLHPTLKTAPKPIFGDENIEIRKAIIRLGTTIQDIVRLSENGSEQMARINVQARALIQRQRTMAKMVPLPTIPDEQGLSQRTVSELKVICDFLGIKKSGLKSVIIQRILDSREVGEESDNEERHNIQIALEMKSVIPAIIGIGGETIKGIRNDTGAYLSIDKTTQVLSISGTHEAVDQAKERVEAILASQKDISIPLLNPNEQRAIIGVKGKEIKGISNDTGAYLSIDETTQVLSISGTHEAVDQAKERVEGILNKFRTMSQIEIRLNEPGEIGAIIGPRGEIIQQIRADTGTSMRIDNESGIVRISGAQEAVEKARKLVEGLLEDRREEKKKAKIEPKKQEEKKATFEDSVDLEEKKKAKIGPEEKKWILKMKAKIEPKKQEEKMKAKIEPKKQEEKKKAKSEPKQTKHFAMLVADELSHTPPNYRPSDRDSLLERVEMIRNMNFGLWEAELNSSILKWLSQKKKISISRGSTQTITYDL